MPYHVWMDVPHYFPLSVDGRSADSVFYRSVTGSPSHWSPRTRCLMVAAISELYLYLKCKNSPAATRTALNLEQLLGILTITGGGVYQWARIAASHHLIHDTSLVTANWLYIYITKYFLNHQIFGRRVRKYSTVACVTAAIRRVRWRSQKNQLINILINVHTDIIILSIYYI